MAQKTRKRYETQNRIIFSLHVARQNLNLTYIMPKSSRNASRIILAVILTLGLGLSHACAALSSLGPPSFCNSDKSTNHQVDRAKKTSCKLRPCKSGQGNILVQESIELRDTKGSSLSLAIIPPGQFGTALTLADHRRVARIDSLHPPPDNSPPIFIKHCSLLR